MIRTAITLVVSNYILTFFVLGVIVSAIAVGRLPRPRRRDAVADRLLAWYVFFDVGVMYLANFVFHVFFGALSAKYIGWADSPFQFEVGTASLGFSAVGFLAAFGSFDRRLMAVVGPSIFLLGAAAGHVRQMVEAHNFAPGNAGAVFDMDIVIPLVGFVLVWLARPAPNLRT